METGNNCMKNIVKNTACHKQSGFTLIEALVTFLVLAIGLLGLAGLQTKGLQFDQSAYQRTQASFAASDIADRMRANVTGARAMDYTINYSETKESSECVTSPCTPLEMANYDLYEWKVSMAQILPSGNGSIVTAAGAIAGTVDATITVYWDEQRTNATVGTVTGTDCINGRSASAGNRTCFAMQVTL